MWLLEQVTSRRNTNQLQKAFIEQAAQCDAFNVKGRTMPMTSPYTPGDMLRQSAIIQSSAYIGIAAILAVFIVAFATAPKARAQDNGHRLHHADHYSKWKQPGTNASCCNGKETNWETSIQRALLWRGPKELLRDASSLTLLDIALWCGLPTRVILRGPSPAWSGAAQAAGGARFASSASVL
jgi:hypothetical protein